MSNHEKAIQEFESHCGNGKEIHGGNYLTMIGEKRKPALAWITVAAQSPYIPCNRTLGDLEAELEKFAMNLRCTPACVLHGHGPDQIPNLGANLRPPTTWA